MVGSLPVAEAQSESEAVMLLSFLVRVDDVGAYLLGPSRLLEISRCISKICGLHIFEAATQNLLHMLLFLSCDIIGSLSDFVAEREALIEGRVEDLLGGVFKDGHGARHLRLVFVQNGQLECLCFSAR